MKTRKWNIVMVRVMLSKEQVHFILISMRLSSCFFLSHLKSDFFYLSLSKVAKLRVEYRKHMKPFR